MNISTDDASGVWRQRTDDSVVVCTDPIAVFEYAFPQHVFTTQHDAMTVSIGDIGMHMTLAFELKTAHDFAWCRNELARLVLRKFSLDYIGRRLICNAIRKDIVDGSVLTERERGMHTAFGKHVSPFELTTERLVQLVIMHNSLQNTDSAPQLQIEPMAPRKSREPGIPPQDLFRCFFVHKEKRATPIIFSSSIQQAQKHALIHLLVGLTSLK